MADGEADEAARRMGSLPPDLVRRIALMHASIAATAEARRRLARWTAERPSHLESAACFRALRHSPAPHRGLVARATRAFRDYRASAEWHTPFARESDILDFYRCADEAASLAASPPQRPPPPPGAQPPV